MTDVLISKLREALRDAKDLPGVLGAVLDAVSEIPGVERSAICLPDLDGGEMRAVLQRGLPAGSACACRCRLAEERALERVRGGEALFLGGETGETLSVPECSVLLPTGGALVPMEHGAQFVGVLLAGTSRLGGFPASARILMRLLAATAAPVLRSAWSEHVSWSTEDRYRSLLRQSSDGVFIFDPASQLILESNGRLQEILGYTEAELRGRSLKEVIAAPPESIAANVEMVIGNQRHYVGERKYRRKDGSLVDVEVTSSAVHLDLVDAVLVNVRDNRERKVAEALLANVQRRHQLILDAAGEGILGLDRAGRHTFVNPAAAQLLGYEPGELVGRESHSLWHHTHRHGAPFPEKDCPIYAAIHDGKIHRSGEEVFWRKDGSSILVEYVCTPILEGRSATGAVVVFRDVSKVARLEAIAEAVETMNSIGYIFSAVRHELGNPVNSVKMALSVLRAGYARFSESAIQDYLDRALSELGRVEELLASLKSLSLYENVRPQGLDLTEFLEQFLVLVTPDYAGRGISLSLRVEPQARRVLADPRALQQVLLNLLANAADALAGRPTPLIVLRTDFRDGLVQIRVEDNGIGIPEQVRKEIFRPFWTTKASGTGLGLAIVRKMMAKMDATVEIESWPGAGTTVILTLPADRAEDAPGGETPGALAGQS